MRLVKIIKYQVLLHRFNIIYDIVLYVLHISGLDTSINVIMSRSGQ